MVRLGRLAAGLILASLLLAGSPAGAVDFPAREGFVLALTWYPGFCGGKAEGKLPSCRHPGDFPRSNFVLHGLWPNWDIDGDHRYKSGKDDYCRDPAGISRALGEAGDWTKLPALDLTASLRRDLARVMPGIERGLDQYEYAKHGICSGFAAEAYFATAIRLLDAVNRGNLAAAIRKARGRSLSRGDLLAAFMRDWGADNPAALRMICRQGALVEIRIGLAGRRHLSLDRSMPIAESGSGNCPALIAIPEFTE